MSIIKRTIIFFIIIFIFSATSISAEELKKIGKFKDWETLVLIKDSGLTCFVQTKPVLQSPKANKREARLFVSFRPSDKVTDEISTTSGYEFNSQNSILATSGKRKYKFDIAQDSFAWISNNNISYTKFFCIFKNFFSIYFLTNICSVTNNFCFIIFLKPFKNYRSI